MSSLNGRPGEDNRAAAEPRPGNPEMAANAAYAELRRAVLAAGLLERARGYYLGRTLLSYGWLAVGLAIGLMLPASLGWSALAALLLGFATIQVALIGHDAAHLAVCRGRAANWALGRVCWSLTVGIGFWYWADRHNRHHAHTNDEADDPDLAGSSILAFTEADAAARQGWRRTIVRYQASLSPLFLLFAMVAAFLFRAESWLFTLRRLRGRRRFFEILLLSLNIAAWLAPAIRLGWVWVAIYCGAQVVAGVYFSAIVAPNHKGMPVWASGVSLPWLERQVLSSRNIHAHPVWDYLFGGLNYQIEHHLFPTMPRVNLSQAQAIVKPFCAAHGLAYEDVDPVSSYLAFFAQLRRVGRSVE